MYRCAMCLMHVCAWGMHALWLMDVLDCWVRLNWTLSVTGHCSLCNNWYRLVQGTLQKWSLADEILPLHTHTHIHTRMHACMRMHNTLVQLMMMQRAARCFAFSSLGLLVYGHLDYLRSLFSTRTQHE